MRHPAGKSQYSRNTIAQLTSPTGRHLNFRTYPWRIAYCLRVTKRPLLPSGDQPGCLWYGLYSIGRTGAPADGVRDVSTSPKPQDEVELLVNSNLACIGYPKSTCKCSRHASCRMRANELTTSLATRNFLPEQTCFVWRGGSLWQFRYFRERRFPAAPHGALA